MSGRWVEVINHQLCFGYHCVNRFSYRVADYIPIANAVDWVEDWVNGVAVPLLACQHANVSQLQTNFTMHGPAAYEIIHANSGVGTLAVSAENRLPAEWTYYVRGFVLESLNWSDDVMQPVRPIKTAKWFFSGVTDTTVGGGVYNFTSGAAGTALTALMAVLQDEQTFNGVVSTPIVYGYPLAAVDHTPPTPDLPARPEVYAEIQSAAVQRISRLRSRLTP